MRHMRTGTLSLNRTFQVLDLADLAGIQTACKYIDDFKGLIKCQNSAWNVCLHRLANVVHCQMTLHCGKCCANAVVNVYFDALLLSV